MTKIKAALLPCQRCDAGRIHNQRKLHGGDVNDASIAKWKAATADANNDDKRGENVGGVTPLSADNEEVMRQFLATLFALPPHKLLIIAHVMRGRTLASFASSFGRYVSIKHCSRSSVQRWTAEIMTDVPQFFDTFRALLPHNRGRRWRK